MNGEEMTKTEFQAFLKKLDDPTYPPNNPNFDPANPKDMKIMAEWARINELFPQNTENWSMEEITEEILEQNYRIIKDYIRENTDSIGEWARLHREYLIYYDKERFLELVRDEESFKEYLTQIQTRSEKRLETLTDMIAKQENAEELKNDPNPLKYAGAMNNIAARVREILRAELSQ